MKSFKELIGGIEEARLFASYQDAANAAGPGQKPKLDASSNKYILVREETIAEAQVSTKKYSWGTMKTIHHGSDFSIPLHPEHHKAIAKLKDEQEHNFKTEDGKSWTARRKGADVHFQGANNGGTTKVPHSTMSEELKGNQKKIDKNKNGKLDAADFKLLRKEAKDEKEYGYEGSMAMNQLSTLTRCADMIKDMLKPDTDLPEWVQSKITLATDYIQDSADYMYSELKEGYYEKPASAYRRKGDEIGGGSSKAPVAPVPDKKYIKGTPENKAYKATKKPINGMPTCEEVELDEAFINGREYASQGLMHPDHAKMNIHQKSNDHVDFYASRTGDKMMGKVIKNDGKNVHIQAHKELGDGKLHKFKVSSQLDEVLTPSMGAGEYVKDFKKSTAPQFDGKSKEKRRVMAIAAYLSARRGMSEEVEQVEETVQKADIPAYLRKAKGDTPLELKDLKRKDTISDAENLAKNRGVKEQKEGTMKSYKEFVTEIKMSDLPSRSVKGTSYGAQYHDPEGDDDADNKKPAKAADAPKRGRGRPAGSTSGARQQGSAKQSKSGGADYTGYKVHLPNTNK